MRSRTLDVADSEVSDMQPEHRECGDASPSSRTSRSRTLRSPTMHAFAGKVLPWCIPFVSHPTVNLEGRGVNPTAYHL